MRIDIIEKTWADLESSFKNSKFTDRREFLKGLVQYNGTVGANSSLKAMLKTDLDSSTESIERYNAICNMLDKAEAWLIANPNSEIINLNLWLDDLAQSSVFNVSKISMKFTSDAQKQLQRSIASGYILPGCYGSRSDFVMNAKLDGYQFFGTATEVALLLKSDLSKVKTDSFFAQMIHILYEQLAQKTLTFPCVFVSDHLLSQPIVKWKRSITVSENDVRVLPQSDTKIDMHYDIGIIDLSAGTKIQAYKIM